MAHVQKRGAKWQARFRDPNGREHAKRFDRKVDAERWVAENEAERNRGSWINPNDGRTLFGEWADTWWATTPALRPSTRARDLSYMRTHILPVFGHQRLSSIDHMAVTTWVAELTATGKAPATVHKAHQILSKIMASAVDARKLAASPCTNVKLPRIEREEMRFLSPEEIARLADAIDPRYRAMVLLGCYAGLRMGEMAGLKRSRVQPIKRSVSVVDIVTEVEGELHWGQPKTQAGRRSVSVPTPIMETLVEHMERWSGPEQVFTSPEGSLFRLSTWRSRTWRRAIKDAGVDPLRPHDMRHTAVALWIEAGMQPLQVSRRAGHRSVSFTLDRYGHLFPGAEDAAADALERFVVEPRPADVIEFPGAAAGS